MEVVASFQSPRRETKKSQSIERETDIQDEATKKLEKKFHTKPLEEAQNWHSFFPFSILAFLTSFTNHHFVAYIKSSNA
jgi:hypothetical protein